MMVLPREVAKGIRGRSEEKSQSRFLYNNGPMVGEWQSQSPYITVRQGKAGQGSVGLGRLGG